MISYKKAGVNIDAATRSLKKISEFAKSTFNSSVVTGVGSFSGAVDVSILKKFKKPFLVSTIDGVGTKVKVATALKSFQSVGQDIVNHCSNDLLALGAKPLFFLDYLAFSEFDTKRTTEIVRGMSIACKKIDCPLIGGETAQMPEVYLKGEFDVAGCMVGVVEEKNLVDGSKIKSGDLLLGLASNGLHTNGYSLARKVLLKNKKDKKILKELLRVHKSYSKTVLALSKKVSLKGIVHITGGGLLENIPRVLPKNLGVFIDKTSWKVPNIFSTIQSNGKISEQEMIRTFNMGIGLVLVLKPKDIKKTIDFLKKKKEKTFLIGKVIKNHKKQVLVYG